jgi:hypothetical protein
MVAVAVVDDEFLMQPVRQALVVQAAVAVVAKVLQELLELQILVVVAAVPV